MFLPGQLLRLLPQTLILAVPGQNVLLPADEVGGAERLFGSIGVGDKLVGKVLFLLGQLAGEGALVVDAFDLHIPEMQFIPDADDTQQDVSLFLVAGLHEAGQIEGQRLDKSIQQLLAAAAAGGVGDSEAAVLALALHDDPVGESDAEVGGSDGTIPLGGVRAEFFAAKRPCQRVENAGLALIVVAAYEGETGGRRSERNGLDALDVFGLEGRDLYRHLDTSP